MKKNISFTKSLGVLLVLLIIVCSTCGCSWIERFTKPSPQNSNQNVNTQPIEWGFNSSGDEMYPNIMAISASTNQFDIDSVKLTVYYGIWNNNIEDQLTRESYPDGFDFYIINDEKLEILVRHEEKNFVSEDFLIDATFNRETLKYDFEFKHCEEVTIPKELFSKDTGAIYLNLRGENIKSTYDSDFVAGKVFFYKVENGKVYLSNMPY